LGCGLPKIVKIGGFIDGFIFKKNKNAAVFVFFSDTATVETN